MQLNKEYQERQALIVEKKELQDKLRSMQEENDNLKCALDEKQLHVDNGQNQISQFEDQLKVLDDIQK